MSRMVFHPELVADELGNARQRPHLGGHACCHGTGFEYFRKVFDFLRAQCALVTLIRKAQ